MGANNPLDTRFGRVYDSPRRAGHPENRYISKFELGLSSKVTTRMS